MSMCMSDAAPLRPPPSSAMRGKRGASGGVELPRLIAFRILDDRGAVDNGFGPGEDLVESRKLWRDHHHVCFVVWRAVGLEAQGLDYDAWYLRDLSIIGRQWRVVDVARVKRGLGVAGCHCLELGLVHLACEAEVPREEADHHGRARGLHRLVGGHVLDRGHRHQAP